MKRLTICLLSLLPGLALADDVRCLQSTGGKPIQLQMTLFTDAEGGWQGAGQVQCVHRQFLPGGGHHARLHLPAPRTGADAQQHQRLGTREALA